MNRPRVARHYVVGTVAFVPHPLMRGLWVKTDACVVKVACSACGAAIGEPCKSINVRQPASYLSSTHFARRRDARRQILECGNPSKPEEPSIEITEQSNGAGWT